MLIWFTENSLFPMVTGLGLATILLVMGFMAREHKLILLALMIGIMTGAIVTCEKMIVTDRERVRIVVYEIAQAVEQNDIPRVRSFISRKTPETLMRVNSEMPRYDFGTCRVIGFNHGDFELEEGTPKTAVISFNVTFQVKLDGGEQPIPGHRKIILTFEEETKNTWRMTDYEHRDPRENIKL